jgi:hypothetical protein
MDARSRPIPQQRAADHPPWCDIPRCPTLLTAAGLPHQSRELRVEDASGRHVVSVLLEQHGNRPVRVAVAPDHWPPAVTDRVAAAISEVAGWARTEARRH